ncbi:2-amino-4-hydroxy-6-hydroxymethyldihydropteridine diphosphokinase [Geofilum rubicundum]|uniref:2-amino-4-hydroxy-6-hydroxymethyldihydropteridine pyrophosphokinase n=1 Tax=Geofilum rubicundum JCM 15548 TaxID=1236989 RepID=A0A0E9LYQ6_9BACT|nr:2-amino-4-hydroxy-6-hydroxymethyldihydropteridine diphosphokinase [Geofilum rubicundum]GAO30276.1 2-amino-4-hydroxy-6-hydroxymethyldihydropteridine pyrophosphokinase [Geofilum rubicundum JCM 15548]
MSDNKVVIGLGSNLDAVVNMGRALYLLGLRVTVRTVSSFESTPPIGITDQPDFLNGAVLIETSMTREQLASELKLVEDEMGRDRSLPKYGPRVIDLDIIVWNGEVVDDDFYERDFLRRSVEEIIGSF